MEGLRGVHKLLVHNWTPDSPRPTKLLFVGFPTVIITVAGESGVPVDVILGVVLSDCKSRAL